MASVGKLDSYFTSLINDLMAIERQPVTRLTQQKDSLAVQKAAYSDLKSRMDNLQSAVKALRSSEATYSLSTGRKTAVTGASSPSSPTNATVVTASVSSSALIGTYSLEVTQLARAHTVRGDQKASSDQRLDLAGSFVIGGAANRAVTRQDANLDTVASFGTAELAAGQRGLGTGTYFVETRYDAATTTWQFRLVNSEGTAASVRQADGSFSGNWQAIPTTGAAYDTGRGMTITFGTDPGLFQTRDRQSGAAEAAYTAKGATITALNTHSLNDIAAEINKAVYAEGNEVAASVIDNRLVIKSTLTGAAHILQASDTSGGVLQSLGVLTGAGTFKNYDPLTESARDAIFKVNGIQIQRSKNADITDAVGGMTLSLAADAEGGKATLSVTSDTGPARNAINIFLTKFNELQTYLKGKVSVTKNADGSYTRGSLSEETVFRSLNLDLYSRFNAKAENGGLYTTLSEIGLALDDNLQAVIKDSSKLDAALKDNFAGVQKLMDGLMASMNERLAPFTGDTGYVSQLTKTNTDQTKQITSRIDELNKRLNQRQEQLTEQYAAVQVQLLQMTYTQQMWSSIYGTTNNTY
jgi:flagellar hook-associated protein 2